MIGTMKKVQWVLLMLAAAVIAIDAQPDSRLNKQLEEAMERNAPGWRLNRTPDHASVSFGHREWVRGDEKVSVTYYIRKNADEGRKILESRIEHLSVPLKRLMLLVPRQSW